MEEDVEQTVDVRGAQGKPDGGEDEVAGQTAASGCADHRVDRQRTVNEQTRARNDEDVASRANAATRHACRGVRGSRRRVRPRVGVDRHLRGHPPRHAKHLEEDPSAGDH